MFRALVKVGIIASMLRLCLMWIAMFCSAWVDEVGTEAQTKYPVDQYFHVLFPEWLLCGNGKVQFVAYHFLMATSVLADTFFVTIGINLIATSLVKKPPRERIAEP